MASLDSLGVEIREGDTVMVVHHGYGISLNDCGRKVRVVGFTPQGNLKFEDDPSNLYSPTAGGRALRPGCVLVARRDGQPGHEGNR